ncbi:response regulator receiver protein [Candidatus Koribacter versatilis Ellin345]|uniref:Response regulator receiver protein n=1 Tax=Koribacter versatilis (strain Ellin345) TaxID=204669 RepID=Q1IV15_KORVE|nr:PEP/pyruvate-binding domain-containing protein [Candidatus Koribacter versatilis]ABF39285.1 response regulator receiver protein [Candidatus Koribacter versatilis Ellin345]
MATTRSTAPLRDAEETLESFDSLMPFRVQDILLVSSLYDSFILREDGRLNELLIGESRELDLQHIPGITHVSNCAQALEIMRSQPRFNLIVTNLAVGEMNAAQLAREIRKSGSDVPVLVLAYDYREVKNFIARNPVTDIDRIFLWQGNARVLVAMVKYIEDKRNALHDTKTVGVPVLLVVEDNIRYYSSVLPVIYTELITQSKRVIREGINVAHKLVRQRARPKILLCSDFEEAEKYAQQYRENLLAVVSDVQFPRAGAPEAEAGFELAHYIRDLVPDVPIVLHSSHTEYKTRAHDEGFAFLQKRSPTFLRDFRRLLTQQCAFGDFVFRLPSGEEVGRASDMNQLEAHLHRVPPESIAYHSQRNHFSRWLTARTEFAVAQKLRPRKVSDFATLEDLRNDLIDSINEYRREQTEVSIGDFDAANFKIGDAFFLRIGSGSLGGKARGLAFMRHLLYKQRFSRRFPGVKVSVPPAVVVSTEYFDRFLTENNLLEFAIRCTDDADIRRRFLEAELPATLIRDLTAFLEEAKYPLAVRSSSLLEDSHYQPFTGVYETFMLGNQQPTEEERLAQLGRAIKLIYASTFSQHAKAYVRATPYRLEEEKMAVIVQQVVGSQHDTRFYPDFSGVVRSHNFYPTAPMAAGDGIAAVALGMGRAVVEGGRCLSFCPRYPRHPIQFSEVKEILSTSQSEFWAMDLDQRHNDNPVSSLRETRFQLNVAEEDGTLAPVASTYSPDNDRVYDGMGRSGARIVSFAPILKQEIFPLARILDDLSKVGEAALGQPVEIEFAVRLPRVEGEPANFGFLQVRPLVLSGENENLHMGDVDDATLICKSTSVLGNGRVQNLRDVVVVDFHRFERGRSQQVAEAVAHFNANLMDEDRPYLLIGVGRWGSNDPWLGIPIEWDEIAGARVIVETGFKDMAVTPSQGSHFFQNLMAFQVGYFTVNPENGHGLLDWDWLGAQNAREEIDCVRHLRFDQPATVVMNGMTREGMIFKPGQETRP